MALATCSLWASLVVSCYRPSANVVECEEGTLCDNGQRCTNGTCMAQDAAVVVVDSCATTACENDQLVGCGQAQVCALGCASGGTAGGAAHCIELKPSNGFTDWAITDGTAGFMVDGDLIVNTDNGEIVEARSGGAIIRSAGAGVRNGIYFASVPGGLPSVFAMQNLTIADGAALRFVGGPAAVLLIKGDAILAGRIDVSAGLDPQRPVGPGGGSGGVILAAKGEGCGGGGVGTSNVTADGGGGGGGFADKGGSGGGETTPLQLGGAGGVDCNVVDLQPLRGGSGGGTGGAGTAMTSFGFGGHGGGALQLSVHNRLVIESTGIVVASGGGGGGGRYLNSSGGGGGGGGAGGGLLLEAPVVVVNGKIFANGGGGGGGAANAVAGSDGALGQESTMSAQGGAANGSGAQGGGGGTNQPARDGRTGGSNGGGGGGSAGIIVVRGGDVMLRGLASPTVRQLPFLTQ
jgi:hypothetical protein